MLHNKYIHGIAFFLFFFVSLMAVSSSLWAADEKIEQQRADIHKMADDTLQRLYTTQPSAKEAIKKAAG